MRGKNHHSALFNAGGCCTAEALRDYLSGRLDPVHTGEVRSHLASCPFCREAADGMKAYLLDKNITAFNEVVGLINREVDDQTGMSHETTANPGKNPASFWIVFSGIMVVFVITGWLTWRFSKTDLQPQGKQVVTKGPVAWSQLDTVINISTATVAEPGKSGEVKLGSKTEFRPAVSSPESVPAKNPAPQRPSDTVVKKVPVETLNTELPEKRPVKVEPKKEIFTVVEEQPQFPGGETAKDRFFAENLRYPAEAADLGIQGKVFVTFVVEEDGSVSEIRVLHGIGGGCDEEAMRVAGLMPRWKPGKQRGVPVRVQFNLPVKFTLTR